MFKIGIEGKLLRWFLFIAIMPLIIIGLFSVRHIRESLWDGMLDDIAMDITDKEIGLGNIIISYNKQVNIIASNVLIRN
ncbi:MAG: hypothetical protein ACE5FY_06225, partial [Nitrospiria bacterium]